MGGELVSSFTSFPSREWIRVEVRHSGVQDSREAGGKQDQEEEASESVSPREAQNRRQFALNQRRKGKHATLVQPTVRTIKRPQRGVLPVPPAKLRKWSVRLIFRPQEPTLDIGDLISGGSADAKESAVWPTPPRPTATSSPLLACDPGPRRVHLGRSARGATCTKLREDSWRFSRGTAKEQGRWRLLAQRVVCATSQLLSVGSASLRRSCRGLVPVESSNPPPALIIFCQCA